MENRLNYAVQVWCMSSSGFQSTKLSDSKILIKTQKTVQVIHSNRY